MKRSLRGPLPGSRPVSRHALSRNRLVARPSPAWPEAAGLSPSGGNRSRRRLRHRLDVISWSAREWRSSRPDALMRGHAQEARLRTSLPLTPSRLPSLAAPRSRACHRARARQDQACGGRPRAAGLDGRSARWPGHPARSKGCSRSNKRIEPTFIVISDRDRPQSEMTLDPPRPWSTSGSSGVDVGQGIGTPEQDSLRAGGPPTRSVAPEENCGSWNPCTGVPPAARKLQAAMARPAPMGLASTSPPTQGRQLAWRLHSVS
jgi:hypothetical protein